MDCGRISFFLPCPSFSSSPSWQFFSPSRSFSGDRHSPDEHENWLFRHLQLLSSDPSTHCDWPSHFCILLTHCKLSHLNSSLLQLYPVKKQQQERFLFLLTTLRPFVILTTIWKYLRLLGLAIRRFRIVGRYAKRYSEPSRKYDSRTSLKS